RGIDLPVRDVKVSRILVGLAVRQNHRERRFGGRCSVFLMRPYAAGKMEIFALADRERHLDWIELRDRREQHGRTDEISHLRLRDSRDTLDWRVHLSPLLVELRGF